MVTPSLKSTNPFSQPTIPNKKTPPPLSAPWLLFLFLTSMAPLITYLKFWLKRILKPFSNPIKPLNNYLELLKINLTQCLAQEFTKFLVPVENHTLVKLVDPLKHVLKNTLLTQPTIVSQSQLFSNTLSNKNT
jgi:hypothetical protein